MFLILMSMLRKSNSIRINMTPLLIISEKLYKILDFDKPKVRYLWIDLHRSIYPVNVFHEGEWSFDSNLENEKISKNLSLAAYALFKFLLYSNYIYSIEQIEIYWNHNEGKIEEQLKYMLGRYKQQNELPIYDVKAYYYLPNLEILDIKTWIKYEKHNSIEYFTNRDMLTDSDFFTKIQSKSVDKYILSSEREMFNYTFDVIGKVTALLSKLYNLPPKIYLGEFIDKTFHKVEFLSFGGIIFDCSITVFRTKSLDKDSKDLICAPKVNQFDLALQVPLNSFALGKTLPIGTVVRLIVYSKMLEGMITSDTCLLNISITSNTITVFCTNIDQKIINLTVLGRLWPGMILVLEDFWCWTDTGIQILLELVWNGDGTTKGWKLMFSKIVFSKLRETWYANNELKYFEPFLKSLNKLYPIEFSNSDIERIEDLFNQDNIKYRIIERNKSRINAELWKYFSYINWDSRKTKIVKTEKGDLVEFCSSNKANKILDGLKLKDYEFYKSKIGLSRFVKFNNYFMISLDSYSFINTINVKNYIFITLYQMLTTYNKMIYVY